MKRSFDLVKRLSRVSFDRDSSKRSTESVRNQTTVKIEFDDEEQAPYLLPKSVIRGKVVLEKGDDLFRIGEVKIKFRCEERQFQDISDKNVKINPKKTKTLFEDEKVLYIGEFANPDVKYHQEDKLDGKSEYRFGLEFPNVNFPLSLRDPAVYKIMYIWTAYVMNYDTPAVITSEEVFSPYRPHLSISSHDNLWGYESIIKSDADEELAAINAEFEQQSYSQDTPIEIRLTIEDRKPLTQLYKIKYNVRVHGDDKLSKVYKNWVDILSDPYRETIISERENSSITIKIPLKDMNSLFTFKTLSKFKHPHYDILLRIIYTDESMKKRFWSKKYKRNVSIPLIIDSAPCKPNTLNSQTEDFQNWPKPLFFSQSLKSPLLQEEEDLNFPETTRRSYYPDWKALSPELITMAEDVVSSAD